MITLDDMEYSFDSYYGNQTYTGTLDNGDILKIKKYGGDNSHWEWEVAVPGDLYGYAMNYRSHKLDSPEDAYDDFSVYYRPRTWITQEEARELHGPVYYRCLECGWEGESSEVGSKTVYEDYGDVECLQCPQCHRVQYDGINFIVTV